MTADERFEVLRTLSEAASRGEITEEELGAQLWQKFPRLMQFARELASERVLIERDSLKAECIRLMDEVARLRPLADEVPRLKEALRRAHADECALRRSIVPMCGKALACGGVCEEDPCHEGPHTCSCDDEGPGICPA